MDLTQSTGPAGAGPNSQTVPAHLITSDGASSGSVPHEPTFPRIEGYQIIERIGSGGMGIVYRAVQIKLNRTVALKVLPSIIATPQAVTRFRREASAAARLHHTHIVPIHDYGESPDGYYYSMELINGSPLNCLIDYFTTENISSASPARMASVLSRIGARGNTPDPGVSGAGVAVEKDGSSTGGSSTRGRAFFSQVASWMADAADALHYAHAQRIIHRDIKPGNMILSSDGRIMITDFGLARSGDAESMTITGAFLGSIRYVSPEQAMAKRLRVDHRTDIYSLGATLYELLTLEPAFPGDDEKEILALIMTKDPVHPRKLVPAIPQELETICLKALEKAADQRYDTARAMAEDLRSFLNDMPIAAKRPGPIRRAMKLVRRHRSQTLAGLIGILLVCGTILGGRVYNQYHGRKHYEAGVRLLEAKDFPHAREELAKAINFGYCSANDPLFHKASLEVELDRQGFISSLTVAISEGKYKEQISSLFRDADQALAERDWEFAADKYYGVLALDPENASALANLAIAKKEQYNALLPDRKVKLLEEGLVLCERALGIDSSRARTWNVKGVLLKMLGKFDEALAAYERARKLNPNDSYYWANIAQVNVLQRNLDLALENLNQGSVSVKPEEKGSCNVLRDLALVEFLRGETQAQTTIERARACDPTEKTLLVRARMRLLSDQPDFQAARDEVGAAERTVKEPHERQYTLRYLALANLRLKRFDHAVESANQAIALGDMPTYNKLILAVAEHHLGHKEKASLVFQEAIDAWPEDLKTEGEFRPSAIKGFLWFESADELFDLRSEIEGLLPPT